ncbi:MAG: extracellular solute-binding protein [Alcaligenaceae bacterium]|nr:extracellular solute-binding protein [Alcaligenaceae bacterium]
MMKKSLLALSLVASLGLVACDQSTQETSTQDESTAEAPVVNVYSHRQEFLIKPMLDEFTKETGIKVNTVYLKKGLIEKLKTEGQDTPADLALTVDISKLQQLVDHDLVAPVSSPTIEANIPANLRSDKWIALTTRTRSVYSSKDRVGKLPEDFDYLNLADPKWKGKICTREGKHKYNLSLFASIIAHHGEAKAKEFLMGLKDNLARKPQGNDRKQVKAIKEGKCDLALGNSYYFGKMITNEKEPEQKEWADAVYINFPNQTSTGTHINVSGVALVKHSKHKAEAMKLIDFLTGEKAQKMYAEVNFEYPVKPGVERSDLVKSWGDFKADKINLTDYAKHYQTAAKLVDEVGFDLGQ